MQACSSCLKTLEHRILFERANEWSSLQRALGGAAIAADAARGALEAVCRAITHADRESADAAQLKARHVSTQS